MSACRKTELFSVVPHLTCMLSASKFGPCGSNSVVECQLPKLDVAGSSPVSRSFLPAVFVASIPSFHKSILLIFSVLLCSACFHSQPGAVIHNSEYHYQRGLQFLKEEQWDLAEIELKYSLELDNTLAPAHLGLAMLNLNKEEFFAAEFHANKALHLRPNWLEAILLKGKIYYEKNDYPAALALFGQAEMILAQNMSRNANRLQNEIHLWNGLCLKNSGQMEKAQSQLNKVLMKDPGNKAARAAIQEIDIFLKSAISQSQEFRHIVLKTQLNRMDWAILIHLELIPLLRLKLLPLDPADNLNTILDLPEDSFIRETFRSALQYKMIFVYPDQTIKPFHNLQRAELVIAFRELWSRYLEPYSTEQINLPKTPLIRDLSTLHPLYEAVELAWRAGILDIDEENSIRLHEPVSGFKALRILNRIKDFLDGLTFL